MKLNQISSVMAHARTFLGTTDNDKTTQTEVKNTQAATTVLMSKDAAAAIKSNACAKTQKHIMGITKGTVEGKPSISISLNLTDSRNIQLPDEVNDFKYGDITVSSKKIDGKREIEIKKGDNVVKGFIKDGTKAKIEYNAAKFSPELVITKEKNGVVASIKLINGSTYKDSKGDFSFVNTVANKPISFKGNYVSLLCKKDATVKATNSAKDNSSITSGAYYDEISTADPSFVVLAGGFGTRFANMTDSNENKPSWKMPNGNSFVSSAYDLILNAQNKKGLGQVTYLEQNSSENPPVSAGLVVDGDKIIPMNAYGSDGGAVIKAVLDGTIPDDKPLIILNADTITNVDLSDAFHKMNKYGDSALVIPRYLVSEDRAKSFGLMGAKDNQHVNDGHLQISAFHEKCQNPAVDAKDAMTIDPQTGEKKFFGNPGIYMISPAVLRNLKELVLPTAREIFEEKAKKDGKPIPTDSNELFSASTFLGNAFIPAIVKLCNEGKLTDISGRLLKPYMVPMITTSGKEADWDDVGSAEAAISKIKGIAEETRRVGDGSLNRYHGIRDLQKLTDSVNVGTGAVYASPVDKALYEYTFADDASMKGNIYIKCYKK